MSHPGNDASQWTRDLWSKGDSLILAYLHSQPTVDQPTVDQTESIVRKINDGTTAQ